MIILASRGQMNEDPVIFTLTDEAGLVVDVLLLLIIVAAT